ncbi:hypothetical protein ACOSP7_030970 [Xanthoceras sorbifolium]
MDCQVSKPSEDVKDRSPSRINELELQHEMLQKEMELEKVVCTNGIVGSYNYISENVEVEEGEISWDFDVNDALLDIFLDDSVVSEEKKVDGKQVNGSFYESTSFIMNTVDHANSDRAVELEESVSNERQFKSKSVVHGALTIALDSDMYNCVAVAGRNKRKVV